VTEIIGAGLGVVSGFMSGSDMVAQLQAIKLAGSSVGVLGYGQTQIYPASFLGLTQQFLNQGGTLISQFSPWAKSQKWRFLARNELVAGLARSIIVTEALPQSGTRSTVTAALKMAKPVGVLKTTTTSEFNLGVKALSIQGAVVVCNFGDFINQLGQNFPKPATSKTQKFRQKYSGISQEIITKLANQPLVLAELIKGLDYDLSEVINQLTDLEIAGVIQREAGVFRLRFNSNGVIECSSAQRALN
jgi:DNA processing protein